MLRIGYQTDSRFRGVRTTIRNALGVLIVVSAIHAGAMLRLAGTPSQPAHPASAASFELVLRLGAFVSALAHALPLNLWGAQGFPMPKAEFLFSDAAYGWAIIACGILIGIGLYQRYCQQPTNSRLTQLCVYLFSATGLLVMSAMVIVRLGPNSAPDEFLAYLVGARYIILDELFALMLLTSLILSIPRVSAGVIVLAAIAITTTAVVEESRYVDVVLPAVWPQTKLSHQFCWDLAKKVVSECRARGWPAPDLKMTEMTEIDASLRFFEPMLRHDLQIPPNEILHWRDDRTSASSGVPDQGEQLQSLFELRSQLNPAFAGDAMPLIGFPSIEIRNPKDPPNLGVPIAVNGISKIAFWIDPPASVIFHNVKLGENPKLSLYIALHPHVWTDLGNDGAVFQIMVSQYNHDRVLVEKFINPVRISAERRWNPLVVPLSEYKNQTVDICFHALPGPANNDHADWCLWAEPRIAY